MTKKTRIIVLSDNRSNDCRLQTEHGLSVYMESTSGKFLLDTGASDLFVRNAEKLGIDLSDVDYCLISHGHNDHIGGLMAFLEINKKAKIILSSYIPGSVYVSVRRYQHSITGNVDFTKYKDRFIFVRENTIINDIHVYADISMRHTFPLGDKNLLIRDETGNLVKDTFRHELAFVVDGILFTGCAHNGIINILGSVDTPFHISIGGFHLLLFLFDDLLNRIMWREIHRIRFIPHRDFFFLHFAERPLYFSVPHDLSYCFSPFGPSLGWVMKYPT